MKFYSDMTKKLYESEEELKTAEKEVAEAEAKFAKQAKISLKYYFAIKNNVYICIVIHKNTVLQPKKKENLF